MSLGVIPAELKEGQDVTLQMGVMQYDEPDTGASGGRGRISTFPAVVPRVLDRSLLCV